MPNVIVSISLTAVFTVLALVLIWSRRVSAFAGTVLFLAGFTLASTGVAGPVNAFLAAIATAITYR